MLAQSIAKNYRVINHQYAHKVVVPGPLRLVLAGNGNKAHQKEQQLTGHRYDARLKLARVG